MLTLVSFNKTETFLHLMRVLNPLIFQAISLKFKAIIAHLRQWHLRVFNVDRKESLSYLSCTTPLAETHGRG